MQFKDALKKLEDSAEFKSWRKENADSYLSYGFTMVETLDKPPIWSIGYYDKKKDSIITFVVSDHIEINETDEIFKPEEAEVHEIGLDKITSTYVDAISAASAAQKEKYPSELPSKMIIILQNLTNIGNVWNITFITRNFNVLNMKVSAEDLKVREMNLSSALSFKAE